MRQRQQRGLPCRCVPIDEVHLAVPAWVVAQRALQQHACRLSLNTGAERAPVQPLTVLDLCRHLPMSRLGLSTTRYFQALRDRYPTVPFKTRGGEAHVDNRTDARFGAKATWVFRHAHGIEDCRARRVHRRPCIWSAGAMPEETAFAPCGR